MKTKLTPVLVALCFLSTCVIAEQATTPQSAPVDQSASKLLGLVPEASKLDLILKQMLTSNPSLKSSISKAHSAWLELAGEKAAFYTPSLNAAVENGEAPHSIPATGFSSINDGSATAYHVGVESPIAGGVYGGLGVRQIFTNEDNAEDSSTAGGYIRIPLMQDSGFAIHKSKINALNAAHLKTIAEKKLKLLDSYASTFDAFARYSFAIIDAEEIKNAVTRAEKLVEESSHRAALKDIAQYQVYPAEYEVAIRKEELHEAEQNIQLQQRILLEAIGITNQLDLVNIPAAEVSSFFSNWAEEISKISPVTLKGIRLSASLPELLIAEANIAAATHAHESVVQQERSKLDLKVGAGWDDNNSLENEFGYNVSLVFSTPLGSDGSKYKLRKAKQDIQTQTLDANATAIACELRIQRAELAFSSACNRLALATKALEQAQKVLASENERFSIGDGTSRNVLDAQQDLTMAVRRKHSIALEVILSANELCRASGVSPYIYDTFSSDSPLNNIIIEYPTEE